MNEAYSERRIAMQEKSIYHSVMLDKDKCRGCTTCLRRCPTEAIRVRNGKAHILSGKCIDCGNCIRTCPYHAKIAVTDALSSINNFKYKIALPAPSLYGQFRNLKSIDQILSGLIAIGFDDVYEVARGADIAAAAIREHLKKTDVRPLISSACPAVVKLIQVRFPELIGNIVNVLSPMEIAAKLGKEEYSAKHDVPIDQIGAFFITPCPAKMTSIRSPTGMSKSYVDGAISIIEIYGRLATELRQTSVGNEKRASRMGINWAKSGGECEQVGSENALAVDGINDVIHVLEEIENDQLRDLEYFEGLACPGGCMGGPLVYENAYVAQKTLRKMINNIDASQEFNQQTDMDLDQFLFDMPVPSRETLKLDDNLEQAIRMMDEIERLTKTFKGLDCGSCGSPTCRALSEDIVRGYASEMDCIFKLKERVATLARQMVDLSDMYK